MWNKDSAEEAINELLRNNPDLEIEERVVVSKTGEVFVQGEFDFNEGELFSRHAVYREMNLSESAMQISFVSWVRSIRHLHLALQHGFAIPNGGKRPMKTAKTMRDEGLEAGVSDYMFLFPSEKHSGLIIEFKVKYNQPTGKQKSWLNKFAAAGFRCAACWSKRDAQELTCATYKLPKDLYKWEYM